MSQASILAPSDWTLTTLGDRITAGREALGISQSELAQRIGLKDTTIKLWENDELDPRANRIQMLAGVLGVSLVWLLSGEGDDDAAPNTGEASSESLSEILRDMRELKTEMLGASQKLSRLEKRLRAVE